MATPKNQSTATELLVFANLQIAAEALYGQLEKSSIDTTIIDRTNYLSEQGDSINSGEELLNIGNKHASRFTITQAEEFVKQWKIVSHLSNTTSGFSGTLFEAIENIPNTDIKKGDLVISFRSTEFVEDQVRDCVATNTLEIAKTGWAVGQISDMERWFQSLQDNGLIAENQKINVTGYSLGGHLATAFHILHSDIIKNTFTFNGAGVGTMGGDEITTKEELYSYC